MRRYLCAFLISGALLACKPVSIEPFVPDEPEVPEVPGTDVPEEPGTDVDPVVHQGEFSYTGERISFSTPEQKSSYYDVEMISIPGVGRCQGRSGQGFTTFGNTAFFFYDGGYCQTVDLETREIIAAFALPGEVCNKNNHSGQANFTGEYYHADDPFPLMYLSSYLEKCCYVLRMTTTGASLIQTIYLTDGTKDENGMWNLLDAQAFFPDGEKLIIKMGGVDPTGAKYKYWEVFDMPYSKFGEKYYLFDEKKTDQFYIRTLQGQDGGSRNFYNAGCALNGRIYVLAGFRDEDQCLLVMDYDNHRIVTDIHWGNSQMKQYEQEQCSIWKENKLLVNFNGADYLACIDFGE